MTAAEAKDALRRRHPACGYLGTRPIPGPWTTVEEYMGIDLVALSAHATPSSGRVKGVRYPRVGYEVKVARADYRRELLRPNKRRAAVEWCNAFFFAVPTGLLTAEEVAYAEPDWEPGDFAREPCPLSQGPQRPPFDADPGPCYQGKRQKLFVGPLPELYVYRDHVSVRCEACNGRGYLTASRVEREAPTLWVPRDVGLIEIDARGCRITKPAPARRDVPGARAGLELANLIRWVSARPDPRHAALRAS